MSASAVTAPAWGRAFSPLGRRTLLVQLVVLIGVEAVLFASYRQHEAGFHWSTHFLVGLTTAALVLSAWLALKGAPARGQLMWVLGLHLFAMFPDLLFSPGQQPHDEWMDVFLGHISSHYIPGGDATWLVIALAAGAAYCCLLSRWLAARRAEADAGLAPGIGIGGGALLRAQRSPREEALAHTRFGPPGSPQVLLLHGLGASREVWRDVVGELERRGVSGVAADLLGFGASRGLGTEFGLPAHVAAVEALLQRCEGDSVVVVGHSFGCAVAVELARSHHARVRALVLVSPPVFRDPERARERLGRRSWLARQVLRGSPVASVTCGFMCLTRPLAGRLVARALRTIPEKVARDGVQHSWPAYRDAVTALLEDNPLPAALQAPPAPTTVVLGDADEQTPAQDVLAWPHEAVGVVELDGDHLVPLRRGEEIAGVIAEAVNYSPS